MQVLPRCHDFYNVVLVYHPFFACLLDCVHPSVCAMACVVFTFTCFFVFSDILFIDAFDLSRPGAVACACMRWMAFPFDRMMHAFLGRVEAQMRESALWRGETEPQWDETRESLERIVMHKVSNDVARERCGQKKYNCTFFFYHKKYGI